MTSSTKPDIVEHVARAIFARKNPAEFLDHMYSYEREDSIVSARAAIRATLEYARDNVSDRMELSGLDAEKMEMGPVSLFSAMIDALLSEIDQGGNDGPR